MSTLIEECHQLCIYCLQGLFYLHVQQQQQYRHWHMWTICWHMLTICLACAKYNCAKYNFSQGMWCVLLELLQIAHAKSAFLSLLLPSSLHPQLSHMHTMWPWTRIKGWSHRQSRRPSILGCWLHKLWVMGITYFAEERTVYKSRMGRGRDTPPVHMFHLSISLYDGCLRGWLISRRVGRLEIHPCTSH